jgi:hypothetical protein
VSSLRVVDLHPEELIEREGLGLLDDAERARLDAHVERCAACRFERQLRSDFGDELDGPDVPLAPMGLVADVLARASGPRLPGDPRDDDGSDLDVRPRRGRAGRRTVARAVWLLGAAALLLLAGGAAAAIGLGGHGWPALLGHAPLVSVPAAAPAVVSSPKPHATLAPAAPPVDTIQPAMTSEAARPVEAAMPMPAPIVARPVHVAGPEELFDAETVARHHADYARVFAIHHELEQRYSRSRESQVSRATVGHLLLDRGDPAGALADFDAYLAAGSGNLGEEAMVGRATALDRLGRTAEASTAWRALLAAFPDSPYAAHAKARVESLIGD